MRPRTQAAFLTTPPNRPPHATVPVVNSNAGFLEQPVGRRLGKHRLDANNAAIRDQVRLRKNAGLTMAALREELDYLLLHRVDVDHAFSKGWCQIILGCM